VRSTHGVNCTGSCSWKIYVKGGIVTWETQQTDYPRTRWDMPNHEPRGCARGASYSWYLYSANRVKYPMVRGRLLKSWREARLAHGPGRRLGVRSSRTTPSAGLPERARPGRFVRSSWDEVNEMIAAANVYTIKKHGPDRVIGFSPIPAMSMVSYAAGSRYLSLIGGVCMSFYDWYCDLPPSQPADLGRADRRAGVGRLVQLQLHHCLGLQRAADAHAGRPLLHRGALQGHQDGGGHARLLRGGQAVRHLDAPQAGHRRRRGHGHGPCDPEGVLLPDGGKGERSAYFDDYVRRYTDMPMLVMLKEHTACRTVKR
jgi:nitrate reductase alpha subunit